MEDARLHSPAAERNGGPILAALQSLLPATGVMLEIASGTGQHAAHFAAALPGWQWRPTDAHAPSLASIAAWCAGLNNVAAPIHLDVLTSPWPGASDAMAAIDTLDAVYCANLLHISPWATCAALMQGAAQRLKAHGLLLIYGPFIVDGEALAASNASFDIDLRSRDTSWGLRRLSDVTSQALAAGLRLRERRDMPANNMLLVFEKASHV
jgi:SAM-dependent methyltransferase